MPRQVDENAMVMARHAQHRRAPLILAGAQAMEHDQCRPLLPCRALQIGQASMRTAVPAQLQTELPAVDQAQSAEQQSINAVHPPPLVLC